MTLIFNIQQKKNEGEKSWGWALIDSSKNNEKIAQSVEYKDKDGNLLSIKELIANAKNDNIVIRELDGKEEKPEDGVFYLNISKDNNWSISNGDKQIAAGLSKLQDAGAGKYFLELLPQSDIRYENPDDDPAKEDKDDDNTEPNISGS